LRPPKLNFAQPIERAFCAYAVTAASRSTPTRKILSNPGAVISGAFVGGEVAGAYFLRQPLRCRREIAGKNAAALCGKKS
jgi:hypothetical protein